MFALREIIFLGFLLFGSNQLAHSLLCYDCVGCDDPFNSHGVGITTVNVNVTDGYSCAKYWDATQAVIRGPLLSCTPVIGVGNGIYCCNTNLCNDTNQINPKDFFFILTLGFILIGMFFKNNFDKLFE